MPRKMPPLKKAEFLVVDVETTGLATDSDLILQIGAVVTNSKGQVLRSYSTYVRPSNGGPFPWGSEHPPAHHIHGITTFFVKADCLFHQVVQLGDLLRCQGHLACFAGAKNPHPHRPGQCPGRCARVQGGVLAELRLLQPCAIFRMHAMLLLVGLKTEKQQVTTFVTEQLRISYT